MICPAAIRVLLLLLILLPAGGCANGSPATSGTQRLDIGGRSFELELAMDRDARHQGLSDRAHIEPDGGMLFVFPAPVETCFVMRRCLVPIDLVFVGPNARIVSMHRMAVEPYDTPEEELRKYCSGWRSLAAIEFASGTIDDLGLRVGDRLDLPLEALKRQAQ